MFRQIRLPAFSSLVAIAVALLAVPLEAQTLPNRAMGARYGEPVPSFWFTPPSDRSIAPADFSTRAADLRGVDYPGPPAESPYAYARPPAESPYAADCDADCSPGYGCGDRGWYGLLDNVQLLTTIDGFQGPLDLDALNGNYGVRFAANGGFPVYTSWGIGGQVGVAQTLADFHGTQFTGSEIRSQTFVTVGLFQRNPTWAPRYSYGVAYDWLRDEYYSGFHFQQWRARLAWHWDQWREVGVWACIPAKGDSVDLPNPAPLPGTSLNEFEPIAQGGLYYRHYWDGGKTTSCWLGLAEEPGDVVFGADARMPLSSHLAVVGGFQYILPSASGTTAGAEEEFWNLSFGIELVPGIIRARPGRFFPFMPLADNGNFAVGRY